MFKEEDFLDKSAEEKNEIYLQYIQLLEMQFDLLKKRFISKQNATCHSISLELIQNLNSHRDLSERNIKDIQDACQKFSFLVESKNDEIRNLKQLLKKIDTYKSETKKDLLGTKEEVRELINIVLDALKVPYHGEQKWKAYKSELIAGKKVFSSSLIQCTQCHYYYLRSDDVCPECFKEKKYAH